MRVLIHQPFKQIACHLRFWQAHGFNRIERRRLIFDVPHDLLFLRQSGTWGNLSCHSTTNTRADGDRAKR
ncbi:Uncharacterised protein [Serratia fonticola]|uniref:Uncharacterized protein n=1 Tax=Serratia fonticola TaxID=47917 RepID=A0A4U9WJX4_SERFO|nr:Uncharacterised protein [Serratia fonticola]